MTRNLDLCEYNHLERHPYPQHNTQKTSHSPYSEASNGIPTPPLSNEQRRSSIHTSSTDRLDDEDYWSHRQRVLRPNSPRRYYRPGEKRKCPDGDKKGKNKDKPQRKRRNKKAGRRKHDEGRLTRPSTSELPSSISNVPIWNVTDKPEMLREVAVVSEIS